MQEFLWSFYGFSELFVTIHALPEKPYEMTEGALAGQSTQKSIKRLEFMYHLVMLYVYGLTRLLYVATLSRLGADHMALSAGREQ